MKLISFKYLCVLRKEKEYLCGYSFMLLETIILYDKKQKSHHMCWIYPNKIYLFFKQKDLSDLICLILLLISVLQSDLTTKIL